MKKIIISALALLISTNVIAGTAYPHEIMFINCTHQAIFVTNGNKTPYKFSMNPMVEATNGYSALHSFTMPNQIIFKQPIRVFINHWHDGAMHMYLTNQGTGVTTEVYVSNPDDDYIQFKTDARYVTYYGYRNAGDPRNGTRSILGIGCETSPPANDLTAKIPVMTEFSVPMK